MLSLPLLKRKREPNGSVLLSHGRAHAKAGHPELLRWVSGCPEAGFRLPTLSILHPVLRAFPAPRGGQMPAWGLSPGSRGPGGRPPAGSVPLSSYVSPSRARAGVKSPCGAGSGSRLEEDGGSVARKGGNAGPLLWSVLCATHGRGGLVSVGTVCTQGTEPSSRPCTEASSRQRRTRV